ncbi:hypothetical protein ACS0TY_014205 [Phlomoides rotata]
MGVEEQVSMFLSVLAHHKKQSCIFFVLYGSLGTLNGIYIDVQVIPSEKGQYRTRKGCVSTNVLGVCDTDMQFVYVLPGWEGSTTDSRVLRDIVSCPHGLKVPKGIIGNKMKCFD